jgi:hypothetical protein
MQTGKLDIKSALIFMPIGYTANLQIYVEIFRVGFNNTDQLLPGRCITPLREDAKS